MLYTILLKCLYAGLMIAAVLSLAAYAVLAERKVSSWIQGRVGPNRTAFPFVKHIPIVGPFLIRLGIWQPLADGLKFLFKEDPIPGHVKKFYYVLAPALAAIPAFVTMAVVPFGQYTDASGLWQPLVLAKVDIGILFILAVSSLSVYGIVLGGWAANSKYPFFGSIRSCAQMVSYELSLVLSILPVFLWTNLPGTEGSFSLYSVVDYQQTLWLILLQPLSAFLFLIALFAETNRLPFDMPESESELVGGFHTEYGSFKFGLFFVAEYAHMIVGSAVFVCLFLGGWHLPFGLDLYPKNLLGTALSIACFLFKIALLMFLFIWVRWTLPRFRYDQVMHLGWKVLLPLALFNLCLNILIVSYL